MIARLRRRHRWLMVGLFALLSLAALLVLTHPRVDASMDALPASVERRVAR